jgi:hypothetical protein
MLYKAKTLKGYNQNWLEAEAQMQHAGSDHPDHHDRLCLQQRRSIRPDRQDVFLEAGLTYRHHVVRGNRANI